MEAFSDCQLIGVNTVMLFLHSVVLEEFARIGRPWAITSGLRRPGQTKSYHPLALALDYRSRHLSPSERATVLANVQRRVSGTFDFIWEKELRQGDKVTRGEHFHGEYDPK